MKEDILIHIDRYSGLQKWIAYILRFQSCFMYTLSKQRQFMQNKDRYFNSSIVQYQDQASRVLTNVGKIIIRFNV